MPATLTLSSDDVATVLAALHACAPIGGGSHCFHLASFIAAQSGINASDYLIGQLQRTAADEYCEAMQNAQRA
jgi:hypothetical protein